MKKKEELKKELEEKRLKKENEEIAHRIMCLYNREKTIKSLKSYFRDEFEHDNEIKPSTTTCKTKQGIMLVANPLYERRTILRKHCVLTLMLNRTPYFLFYKNSALEALFLDEMQCIITQKLTIKYDDALHYEFNRKEDWNGNANTIEKEFEELQSRDYTLYRNTQTPTAQLPVPKDDNGKKTAEFFINTFGNRSINEFLMTCFSYHLLHRSGVYNQDEIKKIRIKNSDLKKLFPTNFRLKELINYANSGKLKFLISAQKIKGGYYQFGFDTDIIKIFHREKKMQTIKIPYKLLLKAFSAQAFNHSGLRYFLLIMFGYHIYTSPRVVYRISSIIKLAKLNTTKGNKHLLKTLNNPLKFLHENKILKNYKEITLEDLRQDKSITLYLCEI